MCGQLLLGGTGKLCYAKLVDSVFLVFNILLNFLCIFSVWDILLSIIVESSVSTCSSLGFFWFCTLWYWETCVYNYFILMMN